MATLKKKKRGGQRKNSGRKKGETTTTISFRVLETKASGLKTKINKLLQDEQG